MKLILFVNFILLNLLISFQSLAKQTWILDKDLSTIEFELPILFANNIVGDFEKIQGLVEIDLDTKKNNKAVFAVDIKSLNINYRKYKELLMSDIFFDEKKFPQALVDTRKFSYQYQNTLNLNVDLTIKDITNSVPITLEIITLTKELIQIKGIINFSRTDYKIGIGRWRNTSILKDNVNIRVNLFLFKK